MSGRKDLRRRQRQTRLSGTTNKASLARLQEWFLPNEGIFTKLKFHGNTSWSPRGFVWLALRWAWSERRHLIDAFDEVVEGDRKVSEPPPLKTYQGFMKAMVTWTSTFMSLLWPLLQTRMREIGGRFWRLNGWVPIAFDGSRNSAPRTKENEASFCAPHYGTGKTACYRKKKTKGMRRQQNQRNKPRPPKPQVWITLLWHMGLRLPWNWRLGPSNSSERAHVMELVGAGEFPKNTLFCGDAGFVGYPLWSKIRRHQAHFLVRVGANVDLLTEETYCEFLVNGLVLCWPTAALKANLPPLRLRLVQTRIGQTRVWLLTSVLDPLQLSPQEMVRFYKMRWGIEVEFRGLKQTLEGAKLRSHNPERLLAELNWSIMAMAVAELFALKEQLSKRRRFPEKEAPPDPVKRSLAKTIRAIRSCLRNLNEVPLPGQDLASLLSSAVTDSYQRKASKKARYRPTHPDKKPLGDPNLRKLRTDERIKLNNLTGEIAI
jgi:hypothetical protein